MLIAKLKQTDVIKWVRSRHSTQSKKEYRYTQLELERNKEIEEIFYLFDTDRSGTLEINELGAVVSLPLDF